MKLEKGKFYKTNRGDKAECLNTNYVHTLGMPPGALILSRRNGESDTVFDVGLDGSVLGGRSIWVVSEWDYLEEIRNLPVDAKIFVRGTDGGEWNPRHFAKVEDGKIHTWGAGTTSWSTDNKYDTTPWEQAKLPEESS